MGENTETVVLHGMWASPFVKRVEIALKLKGIRFDYVEEDFQNKTALLLKYNPVYKKVPVLVHNGNPIPESLIILEYIDEVWNNNTPRLLPQDPYTRSQIRFWADFIHKQLFQVSATIVKTGGEEHEKAIEETKEKLKLVEEGVKELLREGSKFVNGDEMGYLDIVMFTVMGAYKINEEVMGIKLVEEEKVPTVLKWLQNLEEHPIVKEVMPPKHKIVEIIQFLRQTALKKPSEE